jgi:hypothetical protein
VAHPLYYAVFFRGLLTVVLWWYVLVRISRKKLRLLASHGDKVGGLGFLSAALHAFAPLAFAFSATGAAAAINLIMVNGLLLEDLKHFFVLYGSIVLVIFAAPYLLFVPAILQERSRSIGRYDGIYARQRELFEAKWLGETGTGDDALTAPDFSAATDLSSEVVRVHEMRPYPIALTDLTTIAVAIVLPFFFAFSMKVPWRELLGQILGVLRS